MDITISVVVLWVCVVGFAIGICSYLVNLKEEFDARITRVLRELVSPATPTPEQTSGTLLTAAAVNDQFDQLLRNMNTPLSTLVQRVQSLESSQKSLNRRILVLWNAYRTGQVQPNRKLKMPKNHTT